MRFLADAAVSPKTIEFLKQFGHEATHVRSLEPAQLILVEDTRYRVRKLPILGSTAHL